MRTRNPDAVERIFRKDFLSVGWAFLAAVIGEGLGNVGVLVRRGARENRFCRVAVPKREDGRWSLSSGDDTENVGPFECLESA